MRRTSKEFEGLSTMMQSDNSMHCNMTIIYSGSIEQTITQRHKVETANHKVASQCTLHPAVLNSTI
jgi:hypothetical protein